MTGLARYFDGRVFSSYEIGSWKPEPGLFLHAAEALGFLPEHCVVVEDSEAGVQAALAARMRVLYFTTLAAERRTAGRSMVWCGACRNCPSFWSE